MPASLPDLVDQLEQVTRQLAGAECAQLPPLLGRRAELIEQLRLPLDATRPPTPAQLTRLQAALAQGEQIRKRLALERGRLRVELEELGRAGALLRRLDNSAGRPSCLDCEG